VKGGREARPRAAAARQLPQLKPGAELAQVAGSLPDADQPGWMAAWAGAALVAWTGRLPACALLTEASEACSGEAPATESIMSELGCNASFICSRMQLPW
jgi:hypothetical protein